MWRKPGQEGDGGNRPLFPAAQWTSNFVSFKQIMCITAVGIKYTLHEDIPHEKQSILAEMWNSRRTT